MLSKAEFFNDALTIHKYQPEIDLFASRLNHQFPCYCSLRPDPGAEAIDSFMINWACLNIYTFPPFSVIPNVLRKIKEEKARK